MTRLPLLGMVAVLAGACAAPLVSHIVRYPQFNYPPTEPKAVAMYTNPPSAEYEVIGEVRARVAGDVPLDRLQASLKEEAAAIGANGVVLVVQDRVTERKIQRPVANSQQPVGTTGGLGGGVTTLPTQTGRTEEVTIRVREKEVTGVVIRFKK